MDSVWNPFARFGARFDGSAVIETVDGVPTRTAPGGAACGWRDLRNGEFEVRPTKPVKTEELHGG
jgi:hypothetical protein